MVSSRVMSTGRWWSELESRGEPRDDNLQMGAVLSHEYSRTRRCENPVGCSTPKVGLPFVGTPRHGDKRRPYNELSFSRLSAWLPGF